MKKNPIPKSPIQVALDAIAKAQASGLPPPALNLSPDVMADLRALVQSSQVTGVPITRAILHPSALQPVSPHTQSPSKWAPERLQTLMGVRIAPERVQTYAQMSALEQQLSDSLWALATVHAPIHTHEQLSRHLGPGHLEGTAMMKKVYDEEVHVLCPCNTILVMKHCRGPVRGTEGGARCQEFVLGAWGNAQAFCGKCLMEVAESE